jgi:hypothetical protein
VTVHGAKGRTLSILSSGAQDSVDQIARMPGQLSFQARLTKPDLGIHDEIRGWPET